MLKMNRMYAIFVGTHAEMRQLQRFRRRWEDNIKSTAKKEERRVTVCPITGVIFLISILTINFPRWTLLHGDTCNISKHSGMQCHSELFYKLIGLRDALR
jgi:hypothetical protein